MSNRILGVLASSAVFVYFLFVGSVFMKLASEHKTKYPEDLMFFIFGVLFLFGSVFGIYAIYKCLTEKEPHE
jgi:hypothetical protein